VYSTHTQAYTFVAWCLIKQGHKFEFYPILKRCVKCCAALSECVDGKSFVNAVLDDSASQNRIDWSNARRPVAIATYTHT
jgi:hypothetical protein